MNDSFLEDLELIPTEVKQPTRAADRHVTTRAVSSPLQHVPGERLETVPERAEKPGAAVPEAARHGKESPARRSSEKDSKKQTVRMKVPEKRERNVENKLRPVENRVKSDREVTRDEQKPSRVQDTKQKVDWRGAERERERERERNRGSGSQASDLSSKENRPLDFSRESKSPLETPKDRSRRCDCSKRSAPKEKDPVAMLNAIKELISTYTKQESAKILRAMQELHLNSQANLIKNFIMQTDDLTKEMHPSKDSLRVRSLMDQNERLLGDIAVLQRRNEELRKKLEEFELLKEENVNLKLRYMELSKQQ